MNNQPNNRDATANVRLAEQAKVVFLVNFLSPNLLEVMREVSRGVGQLDILVSVAMEANRHWQVDNQDLSVTIQKTWTKRKLAHHPGGYVEELFVHILWIRGPNWQGYNLTVSYLLKWACAVFKRTFFAVCGRVNADMCWLCTARNEVKPVEAGCDDGCVADCYRPLMWSPSMAPAAIDTW